MSEKDTSIAEIRQRHEADSKDAVAGMVWPEVYEDREALLVVFDIQQAEIERLNKLLALENKAHGECNSALTQALARERYLEHDIDRLMHEYCRDEMTPEQKKRWDSWLAGANSYSPFSAGGNTP